MESVKPKEPTAVVVTYTRAAKHQAAVTVAIPADSPAWT